MIYLTTLPVARSIERREIVAIFSDIWGSHGGKDGM